MKKRKKKRPVELCYDWHIRAAVSESISTAMITHMLSGRWQMREIKFYFWYNHVPYLIEDKADQSVSFRLLRSTKNNAASTCFRQAEKSENRIFDPKKDGSYTASFSEYIVTKLNCRERWQRERWHLLSFRIARVSKGRQNRSYWRGNSTSYFLDGR